MAEKGDSYTVTLKKSHIDWGTHRYTGSRGTIYGEGYLPIPRDIAIRFGILNSNGTNKQDVPGKNIFYCTSDDGSFRGYLRAQGCNNAGDIYAKQFAADKDLKGLGSWYQRMRATEGSRVTVTWTSEEHITISMNGVSSGNTNNSTNHSPQSYSTSRRQSNTETPAGRIEKPVQIEKPAVNEIIRHKVFGLGRVCRVDDEYISIDFSGTEKEFSFPSAFLNGFLSRL